MTDRGGQSAPHEAIALTDEEVEAVARRLLAQHINQADDWFSWEDYPLLSEGSAFAVSEELHRLRDEAWREASRLDGCDDIDSIQIVEQARGR